MGNPKTRRYTLLFDGTGNTADVQREITNLTKLRKLIAPRSIDPSPFYEKGVGTRVGEALSGNALGSGISERLGDAYRWVTDQLNSIADDDFRIYVFGFSRGAYIARVFCWLLHRCGIPDDPNKCEKLCRLFDKKKYKDLKTCMTANSHPKVDIEMLGLWDTVKSASFDNYNDSMLAPNVKNAYHAMSIDEHRSLFPVLRFRADERARELWFAGVHSDIGGGYPDDNGLSNITLKWMIYNAIDHGLEFKNEEIKENPLGGRHDEYDKPMWHILGEKPRKIRDNDLLHISVKTKLEVEKYIPLTKIPANPNFVEY